MSGVHRVDGGGREAWTAELRTAVVLRGAGYGYVAGLVSGAGVGVVLSAPEPVVLFDIAILSGLVGGFVGLAAGLVGGVLFASAAPCLARFACAARLAGAALIPGILLVGIGALARGDAGSFVAENGLPLAVLSALGIAGGALVGPRVLYGKSPVPSADEDGRAHSSGGDGADSPG